MTRLLEDLAAVARRAIALSACLALIGVVAIGCGRKGPPVKPEPQTETPETQSLLLGAPPPSAGHSASERQAG